MGCPSCSVNDIDLEQEELETLKTANESLLQKLAMLKGEGQELLSHWQSGEKESLRGKRIIKFSKALTTTEADVKAWGDKRDEELERWREDAKDSADKLQAVVKAPLGHADLFSLVEWVTKKWPEWAKMDKEITELKEDLKSYARVLGPLCLGCPDCGNMDCGHPNKLDKVRAELTESNDAFAMERQVRIKHQDTIAAKEKDLGHSREWRKKLEATLREKEKELAEVHSNNAKNLLSSVRAEEALAKRDQDVMMLRKAIGLCKSPLNHDDLDFCRHALSSTSHLGRRLDAMLLRAEAKGIRWANLRGWNACDERLIALTKKADALEAKEKTK